jgi:hypothetical protein
MILNILLDINILLMTFEKKHCSPRKDKLESSCLSKELLISIAKIINQNYDGKIKIKKRSKKKLYEDISKKLKSPECNSESGWRKIDKVMRNLSEKERKEFKNSFRPFQPEKWNDKPNTWLNTTDINHVMEQYENKYPHFKYYPATPIDFNLKYGDTCMVSDLCTIDLDELKDKKSLGLVFNTDPHDKSGQHWFSVYVDLVGVNLPKPTIYYFDSATSVKSIEELPVQILNLIEKLQGQSNHMFDIYYNDIKHQYGNTECGVYCLHFLTEMLKGIPFEKYINRNLTDKKIEKYRKIFFIDNKIIK